MGVKSRRVNSWSSSGVKLSVGRVTPASSALAKSILNSFPHRQRLLK